MIDDIPLAINMVKLQGVICIVVRIGDNALARAALGCIEAGHTVYIRSIDIIVVCHVF